jgi:drug/metabolite transporter (DMT)-like permease
MNILYLILAQVMVGFNIVGAKAATLGAGIAVFLTIRFITATTLLTVMHTLTARKPNRAPWPLLKTIDLKTSLVLIGQAFGAGIGFNGLMYWGLHKTNANVAGIIMSALPAMIIIASVLFLKERLTRKSIVCLLLAVIGLVVMNTGKVLHSGFGSLAGDAIILLALLPEAAYYVLTKVSPTHYPVFFISALMNWINLIVLLPIALIIVPHPAWHLPLHTLLITMAVGFSSALFYVFWYLGAKTTSATVSAMMTALMPITAGILAWLILHETLSAYQYAGMSLIILSIGVFALKKTRRQ